MTVVRRDLDVVGLLERAAERLPLHMRGLRARSRVHHPGAFVLNGAWARAVDLFLGASLLGPAAFKVRGWWALGRFFIPGVFTDRWSWPAGLDGQPDVDLAPVPLQESELRDFGTADFLIRYARRGDEVRATYIDRGTRWNNGERTRNGPLRDLPLLRMAAFGVERERIRARLAEFGGDVPRTTDELVDAAKVAPDEWSRAMYALAKAMGEAYGGVT